MGLNMKFMIFVFPVTYVVRQESNETCDIFF